jgi:hypothetical protein
MPVIVFDGQPYEEIAPGVMRSYLQPGGKDGPGAIVRDSDQPGGCTWSQQWSLGTPEDDWRMSFSDIRMAPQQIWPLHWHDCWTVVVVLDGRMMIGDWWMERGDVLIASPGVEYGMLMNGPKGSEIFEIFARDVLSPGGYGVEYRDHPSLVYLKGVETTDFFTRPPASVENGHRQIVPVEGTPGLQKGYLDGKGCWELGDPGDPDRGILFERKLSAGTTLSPRSYRDWRSALILEGSLIVGDTEMGVNDWLIIEPNAVVPPITIGAEGAHLLEAARTAAAADPSEGVGSRANG